MMSLSYDMRRSRNANIIVNVSPSTKYESVILCIEWNVHNVRTKLNAKRTVKIDEYLVENRMSTEMVIKMIFFKSQF